MTLFGYNILGCEVEAVCGRNGRDGGYGFLSIREYTFADDKFAGACGVGRIVVSGLVGGYGVFLVSGDVEEAAGFEGHFADFEAVVADDGQPARVVGAVGDGADAGGVVVVFFVVEGQGDFDEGIANGHSERDFFSNGIRLAAVGDDRDLTVVDDADAVVGDVGVFVDVAFVAFFGHDADFVVRGDRLAVGE